MTDRIDTAKEREKLAELEGYSQGPWKVRESLDGTPKLDSRDGYTVDRDDPTAGKPFVVSSWRLQNARLIAAAPDLLATLTAALDEIERLRAALAWAVDSLEYQYPGSAPDFEIPKSIRAALKGSDQ